MDIFAFNDKSDVSFVGLCVIRKLFPYGEFNPDMKLTGNKLLETLRRKNDGLTIYQARKIAGMGQSSLCSVPEDRRDSSCRP